MGSKRKKILAWRVKKEHVKPLNELVNGFLKSLNYKLYGKRKKKKINGAKKIQGKKRNPQTQHGREIRFQKEKVRPLKALEGNA